MQIAGTAAGVLKTIRLIAASGGIDLAGQAVSPKHSKRLIAEAGGIELFGGPPTGLTPDASWTKLFYGRHLDAEAGGMVLTGQDLDILRGLLLDAEAGGLELAGQTVTLTWSGALYYPILVDVEPRVRFVDARSRNRIFDALPRTRFYDITRKSK